jgi:hypothetical protein
MHAFLCFRRRRNKITTSNTGTTVENQGLCPPLLSGDVISRVLRELELSKKKKNTTIKLQFNNDQDYSN